MNCPDCEQLFDVYLDGQLTGGLRLEFDAHRLRCERCQQLLAMQEAVGHVLASDNRGPDLPADFTDRVMLEVTRPQRAWRGPVRLAIGAAVAVQAAAVVLFALQPYWRGHVAGGGGGVMPLEASVLPQDAGYQAIRELVVVRVEDRLWDMHAAGVNLTSDLVNLARYFDVAVPEDVARASERIVTVNPWQGFWNSVVGPPPEEAEPEDLPEDVHSI